MSSALRGHDLPPERFNLEIQLLKRKKTNYRLYILLL